MKADPAIQPEYMSVRDAAALLALSPRTIWKWIGAGALSVNHFGRAVRIPVAEIQRLINQDAMPKGK